MSRPEPGGAKMMDLGKRLVRRGTERAYIILSSNRCSCFLSAVAGKLLRFSRRSLAGTWRSMIRRILTICEEWWPTTSVILFRNMQMANLANRLRTGVMMHRRVDAGKEGQLFFGASIRIGQDGVGIGWD